VRAERENLRDVERQVLLQAVTAYMDVVRDQELVRLNENNVNVLSRELKAAQDRFAVGEVTRTDVAQAEARRADAVSRLDAARANLRTSRGSFQQVVGHPPEGLSWPASPEEDIPRSLQDAVAIGNNENPLVVASLYREQAAKYLVDQIRGELLPSVQLEASYEDRFDPLMTVNELETGIVTGRLTVPIYEAYNPAIAEVGAEHVFMVAVFDVLNNGMAPEAAIDKAFKRAEEIFAKYPIVST